MQHLIEFRTFSDVESATDLLNALEEKNIYFEVYKIGDGYNVVPTTAENIVLVKIKQADLDKANSLIPPNVDHFLFTFSDTDIIDVIANPGGWDQSEVEIANKIVSDRKIDINKNTLEAFRNKNSEKVVSKDFSNSSTKSSVPGWFFTIFIFSIYNTICIYL